MSICSSHHTEDEVGLKVSSRGLHVTARSATGSNDNSFQILHLYLTANSTIALPIAQRSLQTGCLYTCTSAPTRGSSSMHNDTLQWTTRNRQKNHGWTLSLTTPYGNKDRWQKLFWIIVTVRRRPYIIMYSFWFFLTHSALVSKLFFLAVQGSGALLSSDLEGALY